MDKPLDQSRLLDHGFTAQERRVRRNSRPIKSLCASCGNDRWLNWIVADKHVCDECCMQPKAKHRR